MQALFDTVERQNAAFLAPLGSAERGAFLGLLAKLVEAHRDGVSAG